MIAKSKQTLRKQKLLERKNLKQDLRIRYSAMAAEKAIQLVSNYIHQFFDPTFKPVIGAYLPIACEIDPSIVSNHMHALGYPLAMPRVAALECPLLFKSWKPEDPLERESFATKAPLASAKTLVPNIMLVPLVAFDLDGYRLGYGGGFYDRTLKKYHDDKRSYIAIGYAYNIQQVVELPVDAFDQKLDAIVTEQEIHFFNQDLFFNYNKL